MNITVVTSVYPPEPVVSSRTSADVAAALRDSGDDVTVICPFPSRPGGTIVQGYRRRWRTRTNERGINTVRCFSTFSRASTLVSRFAENISFGITSALALLRLRKPHVVYLNSWPVFATGLAVLAAKLRRVPYVISVQDVYPESLVVQGRSGARMIARVLRSIDRAIARGASALIVLSEGFASIYRDDRGVPRERIHIIPNWLPRDSVQPSVSAGTSVRRGLGLRDGDVLVVYGGNIGVAAAVEQLVEAFAKITDPRLHLLIAGDGARADACERFAREIAPERIHFHRPWKEAETSGVLSAADILALPTQGQQSLLSVPSKLITYLLAGKPVVAAVAPQSEVVRILEASRAGWTVLPHTPTELASAIKNVASMTSEERDAIGARGREYAFVHFTTEVCVGRVLAILRSAA